MAYFGAYNLSDPYENHRFALSPAKIIIHDDWNPETLTFDADLAVLVFDEEIPFTRYIAPICLWASATEPTIEVGTVIGWGQSEDETKNFEPIPKVLNMPIHSNEDCFLRDSDLAEISSKRTFCAGSGNGTGVCFGDSGHGFFFEFENKFYLKGIVSSAVTKNDGNCNENSYHIFTNIVKFSQWIENIPE